MRRRLTDSTFSDEMNCSFDEIYHWSRTVQQAHAVRCYVRAAGTQTKIAHDAGFVPDDFIYTPWDEIICWATENDRNEWTANAFVFQANGTGNEAVTLWLVKFAEKPSDIVRDKGPVITSTGGSGDSSNDPLGVTTVGQVNETDGTVRTSGGGTPPSAAS
jgi:hypothetical protein